MAVGSGTAGMKATKAADDEGAFTILVDKSLLGRGGETILTQMTGLSDWDPYRFKQLGHSGPCAFPVKSACKISKSAVIRYGAIPNHPDGTE